MSYRMGKWTVEMHDTGALIISHDGQPVTGVSPLEAMTAERDMWKKSNAFMKEEADSTRAAFRKMSDQYHALLLETKKEGTDIGQLMQTVTHKLVDGIMRVSVYGKRVIDLQMSAKLARQFAEAIMERVGPYDGESRQERFERWLAAGKEFAHVQ